jgi:hypothetical protein
MKSKEIRFIKEHDKRFIFKSDDFIPSLKNNHFRLLFAYDYNLYITIMRDDNAR